MSATDPLAAISARVAAAEAAMLEAAINLGVSADVLQAQISIGDILPATILPPQDGQDLIAILGQRVAAQLPPGVHPGETLLLQVSGFSGTQIYVRNLGTPDPQNPLPTNDAILNAPQAQTGVQTAVLSTIRTSDPEQTQQAQPAQSQAQPQPAQSQAQPQAQPQPQTQNVPPVSPPREVFVAASVRQAPPAAPAETPAANPAPAMPGVEARIAAAQAAKLPPIAAKTAPAAPPQSSQTAQTARTPLEKSTIPPLIPARSAVAAAANSVVQTVVQRAAQTVSEFLRAARLPDTPFTRMASTIAPQAPERLTPVLERLESVLPHESQDARVSTLRTLIGFTARFNPADAQTLRAQISSYVSNVIEGAETKLAQLLTAHTQASSPSEAPAADTPPQDEVAPMTPTTAQARAAERSAAISHDLKSIVLSLLRDPPAARTPAMTQALTETLMTLTGTQVNVLSGNQQNPGTFTLTLPVYYHEGGKPAQIRISGDGQSRVAKMDADNFHVAFVLDTANLGTVAIDLQTTGRTVKVDVKTENTTAAHTFSDSLSSLRSRLEDLRYRVASAVASALPSPAKREAPPVRKHAAGETKRGLDLQA